MRHQKRNKVPKNWPIARKGTTFVVKANSLGVPVLVILRDILKVARTKREVKKAIHKRHLLINNKPVIDEKKSMELFDVLTLIPSEKNFRLVLEENGKYGLEEIDKKDSEVKVSKIIGKKVLPNKKVQINFYDTRNYLSNESCKVGDSAIIDLKTNKIKKILPLKIGAKVLSINGKHAGKKGEVKKLIPEEKLAQIKTKDESINVLTKQIMVID